MYSAVYTAERNLLSAGAARTESGAVGFTLCTGFLVLNADFFCAAVIVDSVVLAAGNVAGHTGILVAGLFVVHIINLP